MESRCSVARFIRNRLEEIGRPLEDVAQAAQLESIDVIQIRDGKSPVPMSKVGALAQALESDPFELWMMCMREYEPDTWLAISPFVADGLTPDERLLIKSLRQVAQAPYLAVIRPESYELLHTFLKSLRTHPTVQ